MSCFALVNMMLQLKSFVLLIEQQGCLPRLFTFPVAA